MHAEQTRTDATSTRRPRHDPASPGRVPHLTFAVRPAATLRLCLTVSVVLAAAGLVARLLWHGTDSGPGFSLYSLLDVDAEGTVPAWFSALLLAACAASLWTIAGAAAARGERSHWQWRLLAVTFVYLSLDEGVELHEQAIEPLRAALDLGGVLYYSWIVVAVPLGLALAAALFPFLRRLPRRTLVAFLVAGAVFVGGAVGMEMVGGLLGSRGQQGSTPWHVSVTVEELMEMIGASLFLAAVNAHRERYVGTPAQGDTVAVAER